MDDLGIQISNILRNKISDEELALWQNGASLCHGQNYAAAIPILEKFLLTVPRRACEAEADAHACLAFCYAETGNFRKGLREFDMALECLSPDSPLRKCYAIQKNVFLASYS